MKKTIALLLAICLAATALAACSGGAAYTTTHVTTRTENASARTESPAADDSVWRWVLEPVLEIEHPSTAENAMLSFHNGMGVYNESSDDEDDEYVIINKFGENVYLPTGITPASYHYNDGLLLVSNENGQFGYANEAGEIVIECQYYMARDFGEGLAAVAYDADRPNGTVRGKYPQFFFIDTEGKVAISEWVTEGVDVINNAKIMGGISSTSLTFSPKAPYTHEQSIITLVNLWDYARRKI